MHDLEMVEVKSTVEGLKRGLLSNFEMSTPATKNGRISLGRTADRLGRFADEGFSVTMDAAGRSKRGALELPANRQMDR